MKAPIRFISFAAALVFAASVQADPVAVQSMTIDSGSFQVTTANGTPGTGGAMTFYNTDLVAGAQNPILTFFLSDPLNPSVNKGTVTAFTKGASPASVNGSTFSINLASFNMDWNTGPFPSLCTVNSCMQPQNPQPSGLVSGSWDANTHRYSITWTDQWIAGQHPFPLGTTTWTLAGVATVPEPSAYLLMVSGLLVVSGVAWQRRNA